MANTPYKLFLCGNLEIKNGKIALFSQELYEKRHGHIAGLIEVFNPARLPKQYPWEDRLRIYREQIQTSNEVLFLANCFREDTLPDGTKRHYWTSLDVALCYQIAQHYGKPCTGAQLHGKGGHL